MKALLILMAVLFVQPASALMLKDGKVILERLSDYPDCQKKDYSGDWCHAGLQDWVRTHPADAFEAGAMTRLHFNGVKAIGFFTEAMKLRTFDCKNDQLKLAVLAGLALPSDYEEVPGAQNILRFCKSELTSAVEAELTNDYVFRNSCTYLKLEGLRAKKCAALKK